MATNREWPRGKPDGSEKRSPYGWFMNADGCQQSNRPVAGALRRGTMPSVGPKGGATEADNTRTSDMGMDRIGPRDFDPLGTTRSRFGDIPSDLIARKVR